MSRDLSYKHIHHRYFFPSLHMECGFHSSYYSMVAIKAASGLPETIFFRE